MRGLGNWRPFVEESLDEQLVRLNWLIQMISNGENEYHVYKALVCLKNLCSNWEVVLRLYNNRQIERDHGDNIFSILKKVLEQDKPQLVKVIAQLITKMV